MTLSEKVKGLERVAAALAKCLEHNGRCANDAHALHDFHQFMAKEGVTLSAEVAALEQKSAGTTAVTDDPNSKCGLTPKFAQEVADTVKRVRLDMIEAWRHESFPTKDVHHLICAITQMELRITAMEQEIPDALAHIEATAKTHDEMREGGGVMDSVNHCISETLRQLATDIKSHTHKQPSDAYARGFEAAREAAATVCRKRADEIGLRLANGKGEWLKPGYIRDDDWASMHGEMAGAHSLHREISAIPTPSTGAGESGSFPWKRKSDHPNLFTDGDRYLVAVPLHADSGGGHEYSIIVFNVDENHFAIEDEHGESWGWDWDSVEWYIDMRDLPLPTPPRDGGASCH